MNLPPDIPPEQSLIEYPSQFPIKVMGAQVDGFVAAIAHIARQFDPGFDASTIEQRPSKGGTAEDRKFAGIQPIDDVRDRIERILVTQMTRSSQERWLERLRRNGYVKHY